MIAKVYNIGRKHIKNFPSICNHNIHLEMLLHNYSTLEEEDKDQAVHMIMCHIRDKMWEENVPMDVYGRLAKTNFTDHVIIVYDYNNGELLSKLIREITQRYLNPVHVSQFQP